VRLSTLVPVGHILVDLVRQVVLDTLVALAKLAVSDRPVVLDGLVVLDRLVDLDRPVALDRLVDLGRLVVSLELEEHTLVLSTRPSRAEWRHLPASSTTARPPPVKELSVSAKHARNGANYPNKSGGASLPAARTGRDSAPL